MRDDELRNAGKRPDPVDPVRSGAGPDRLADERDARAEARDRAADARDERADARDQRAETCDQAAGVCGTGAATDRASALGDRRGAARDRKRASDDRRAASGDRLRSARERTASSIDGLTGALHREPGIVELEREIARACRTNQPFTLVFVDVIGLKDTNVSVDVGRTSGWKRRFHPAAIRPRGAVCRPKGVAHGAAAPRHPTIAGVGIAEARAFIDKICGPGSPALELPQEPSPGLMIISVSPSL